MKLITLLFTPLSFWTTPIPPPQCPPSGYIETLVEPAVTEDGFVKASEVVYDLLARSIKYPAKFKVMTQDEYDALDEMMTYTTYKWHYPKYSKTPIELVTYGIAEYDIIRTPDGNMFHRPLEDPVNRPLFIHEVEAPKRLEEIDVSEKRPEPEKLGKGQLKVMMSPEHIGNLLSKFGMSLEWRPYVKSRTPAIYQQERCGHG